MSTRYLITAATGATGGEVARSLLETGEAVRALAHREDARAQRLRDLGAEVVVADLRDLDAMREALRDVQRAYFCYPIMPGIVQATAQFASAAQRAGVEYIVNMSQISAREDATSEAARQHWLAERTFDGWGVPVTHVRPTFFAEWLLYLAPMVRQGVIRAPFSPAGRHAPIAAEDQARVIVGLLRDPARHAGATLPLFGAEELSYPEIAARLGRVLGRTVTYQQTSVESFAQMLGAAPAERPEATPPESGPTFLMQHLGEVALDHEAGLFTGDSPHVREIGGRAPLSVEAFVEKHRAAFAA